MLEQEKIFCSGLQKPVAIPAAIGYGILNYAAKKLSGRSIAKFK